ncbi:MAG TPA: glycine--tRNA ligase [Candidatus Saccharimonadales bacterium]|nr:glycine--tRNA ligase [Candidatus Saccharimonadales bacterium]
MGVSLEDIVSLAKRRGFIFPSSEIYGGLAGVYDYGPLGIALKHNIQNLWWNSFVTSRDDMYPMDAAILMNKKVWEASGHATGFNDPMVECSNCHSRLRQDHIDGNKCPVCGKEDTLGEPKQFNMMFKTNTGPTEDKDSISYLRPETAQGMFVNFKNILDTVQPDMPFGLAQIGKAFRNEISPRDFLFRLREMEQMEIEYFVQSDKWEEAFEQWRLSMMDFFKKVGLPENNIHELEVPEEDRAHYSKRTIDFQFDFPFKTDELAGLAYRGDYDLKNHQEASGKDLQYRPKDGSSPFLPHVIEPSFGVERLVLALLISAYSEDEQVGEKRVFLKLPAEIAPVKVAVFPLLKNKPELVAKAKEVYKMLKDEIGAVMFDDNGNIGKRYRRQDEIGTPWCLTVDFDSLEDDTLTLRSRDTTQQERVKVNEISKRLS